MPRNSGRKSNRKKIKQAKAGIAEQSIRHELRHCFRFGVKTFIDLHPASPCYPSPTHERAGAVDWASDTAT